VTDWIAEHSLDGHLFIPRLFQGFAEVKEALLANRMQAGFLVAPMAIALRAQGAPIKIVYLGHRYGSAAVVRANGPVRTVADLKGRTMAIPSRFSDERLVLLRALRANHVDPNDVRMLEMSPPDVAGALAVGAIDGFVMGEPFPSQAELAGAGRVLFFAKEYWPDYMSCVLVVREDTIAEKPAAVQTLVDGIARSGLWLDKGERERAYAAEFVGRYYFNQSPRLLNWALTKPLDRVTYSELSPRRADFDLVVDLMMESSLLPRRLAFEEYVDTRFAEGTVSATAWSYEPADAAP
jgi:NitT/TauT family transport system substrate-binding protein